MGTAGGKFGELGVADHVDIEDHCKDFGFNLLRGSHWRV